jgi:HSF-type DNA-binding
MATDGSDATLFPQKLMDILADPLNHDAISWLPDGEAFVIRDRDQFFESVMPKYFPRKAKYSSFTRKLNRWYVGKHLSLTYLQLSFSLSLYLSLSSLRNFMRVTYGPANGAFFHKFFQRDQPHLVAQMYCKNARTLLAMASDVAETKHPALLPTDFAKPLVPHAYIDPPAPTMMPLPNKSSCLTVPPSLVSSATFDPINSPYEMGQLETVKSLLVCHALKMRQAQKSRQDRFLQVRRAMVASLQQHRWQQENEWCHSFMNTQARNQDRRGRVPHRASPIASQFAEL